MQDPQQAVRQALQKDPLTVAPFEDGDDYINQSAGIKFDPEDNGDQYLLNTLGGASLTQFLKQREPPPAVATPAAKPPASGAASRSCQSVWPSSCRRRAAPRPVGPAPRMRKGMRFIREWRA
jgi:hypothetical protein